MAKAIIAYKKRESHGPQLASPHVAVGSSSTEARAFPSGRLLVRPHAILSSRRELARGNLAPFRRQADWDSFGLA